PESIACRAGVWRKNGDGGYPTAPGATAQGGTRVQRAARSDTVSFADQIGHFDWCNSIVEPNAGSSLRPGAGFGSGHCGITGSEGPGLTKHDDSDSTFSCFTGEEGAGFAKYGGTVAGSDGSGVVIPGCLPENDG